MRWVLVVCAMALGCAPGAPPASASAAKRTPRPFDEEPSELVNETPGRLSAGQVRRVVGTHDADVRACYEGEARIDPTLQGSLSVSWEILTDGTVSAAMLGRSTLANAVVEECVLGRVRAWRFPASDSQTTVEAYSFRFPR